MNTDYQFLGRRVTPATVNLRPAIMTADVKTSVPSFRNLSLGSPIKVTGQMTVHGR